MYYDQGNYLDTMIKKDNYLIIENMIWILWKLISQVIIICSIFQKMNSIMPKKCPLCHKLIMGQNIFQEFLLSIIKCRDILYLQLAKGRDSLNLQLAKGRDCLYLQTLPSLKMTPVVFSRSFCTSLI